MNLLDHRILIWDFEAYQNNEISPIAIIDYLEFLCESLSTHNTKIDMEQDIYNCLIDDNSIPLGDIHNYYPELTDVHSLILSKLTKLTEYLNLSTNTIAENLTTQPNILSNNYSYLVNTGSKKIFNQILIKPDFHIFLTTESLLQENELVITNNTESKKIPVYRSNDSILEIIDGLGRVFEMNEKHDPLRPHPENKGSVVSILSASSEIAQNLLIQAKGETSNSDKLYNFDSVNNKYVVFLLHNKSKKTYHAHDINDIPQSVKNELNL